jgi:hypothetical protein
LTYAEALEMPSRIDTEKDFLSGSWQFTSGVLFGAAPTEGAAIGRVQVRYVPPADEYNLIITIERVEGEDNIGVGLVAGASRFMYHFDVDCGAYHGILVPNGNDGHRKASSVSGRIFQTGRPKTITLMVRKAGLVVQVDGKDVCSTRQDWTRLAILPQCAPEDRDAFVVAVLRSSVRISKMIVTFPSR